MNLSMISLLPWISALVNVQSEKWRFSILSVKTPVECHCHGCIKSGIHLRGCRSGKLFSGKCPFGEKIFSRKCLFRKMSLGYIFSNNFYSGKYPFEKIAFVKIASGKFPGTLLYHIQTIDTLRVSHRMFFRFLWALPLYFSLSLEPRYVRRLH